MIKDDYLSILDNDFDLKINSVKIEHLFNKIFISNYNSIRQDLVFHQKDGFPMKLSVNSFLVILIECKHKAIQEFKIPIESTIEWKIVNGIKDGAFKHGFGVNTKYSDKDSDTSVIYYPPKEGIGKGKNQTKEISILIKIKSLSDKKINNDILSNNSNDINSIRLNDFDVHQFLLTLYLNQKQGFLNKMLYEVSLAVKKIGIENELDNFSNLHTYKIKEHNFNSSFKEACCIIESDENVYSVSEKHIDNCSYCGLGITFKPELELTSYLDKPKIDIETNRLFTSEFIKINNRKSFDRIAHKNGLCHLLCTIKNKDKDIYKFRIINCPAIKISQSYWKCTAGSFPCGNSDDSVIYRSPEENELSKSPITLSLYEKNMSNNNYEKSLNLIDQKKIWLLRRIIMGG
ncbi:MAG TPA: hypothetical protein VGC75_02860 [Candidatus Nitrosocosmicus sp.]